MAINTWVVEDNTNFREAIIRAIDRADDINCIDKFGSEAALDLVLKKAASNETASLTLPDVVLMDIKLHENEDAGIDLTGRLKSQFPEIAVVMLTSYDDNDKIYRAMCAGANSYLLKDEAFERTLPVIREAAEGGMLMPEAVAKKVRQYFSGVAQDNKYQLTKREFEVLQEMCEGLTQKEMAKKLHISENTVGQHVRSIYDKLQVHTRGSAVAKAFRERLVR